MAPQDGRVIPNFFMQALKGKSLTLYGDGTQTRSLCYVSDMVEGLRALMEGDVDKPINMGGQQEMTILEMAQWIKKITGSSSDFVFKELPENDPQCRKPDITQARELLGWKPQVSMEEGLGKTMEFFKSFL